MKKNKKFGIIAIVIIISVEVSMQNLSYWIKIYKEDSMQLVWDEKEKKVLICKC